MTTWLIDKSALVRLAESPDAAEWAARIERGLVRITTVTRLETGYSARSGSQLRAEFQRPPLASMPVEYLTPAIEDRAVELLTLLADRGHHRTPSTPDLIIAATAELAGLTVLHLDKDFDLIAEITGQPLQRLTTDSAADTGDDAEQTEALSFRIAADAAAHDCPYDPPPSPARPRLGQDHRACQQARQPARPGGGGPAFVTWSPGYCGGMAETQREPAPCVDSGKLDTALAFTSFARHCMLKKADGLSDGQLRRILVDSGTSVLGLVQHLAETERYWFGYRLAGVAWDADREYGMTVSANRAAADALADHRAAIEDSDRAIRAAGDPEARFVVPVDGNRHTLPWVMAHMTSETARHAGHADILREQLDGTTGRWTGLTRPAVSR